ncbi:hypothetical protein FQR65_LT17046 [Abscondita terminalis]|nr:hypothetical protein FQR65_LT17046 [Abscondita terminalis]
MKAISKYFQKNILVASENKNSKLLQTDRLFLLDANRAQMSVAQLVKLFTVWPYFLFFVLLENLILWWRGKPVYRLNDGITSLSIAIISETGRFVFRGAETYLYVYLYDNYRMIDLDWNKSYTWYLALIGVDFCYYWMHRACHEIHILWAQHQVHHSSEDFNIAVGLRHSFIHGWCGFTFYVGVVINKMFTMSTWENKIKAFLFGPSWQPGKRRVGAPEDVIRVQPREVFHVKLPLWCDVYLLINFCIVVYVFQEFCAIHAELNQVTVTAFICYIVGSLFTIGFLFDNAPYAAACELVRCVLMAIAVKEVPFLINNESILFSLQVFFAVSGIFWFLQSVNVIQLSAKKKAE